MEIPDFFIGGYFSCPAGVSDHKPSGDHFMVDDLLDFPNDEDALMMTDGFSDITKNSAANADSTTFTSNDSCNSSCSAANGGYQSFPTDLCVPYDDAAELEWLSNFVEDSFSTDQNLQANLHILPGSKPEDSSSGSYPEQAVRNPNNPFFKPETLPGKARSKRSRAAPCDWSTRLLHLSVSSTAKTAPKKSESGHSDPDLEPVARKCVHCAAEKTPQWRTGPMGPKTLCNACGVRYKSGRLVPEYRPASSPTFVSTKHSNSHRKVLELRRQKELQRAAQHEQFLSQSSVFGVSNGRDDFLVHPHHDWSQF